MENPVPLPPRLNATRRLVIWTTGIVAGDILIALLYWGGALLMRKIHGGSWLGVPSCFLIPLAGGMLASYVWRQLNPTIGSVASATLMMTLVGMLGAAYFFKEGAICLLIVSPLFYVVILVGGLLGRLWFKRNPTHLQVSILPLLAFLALGEPLTRQDEVGAVVDEVLIRAPAAKVWPLVTSFPDIPVAPDFWLFRLGLPYPMATTSTGDYVKANRRCIFNKGAVFKETVAELVPNEKLTFDIIESPPDPELVGHLTPHRGQFLLRDNGDGTTTLIGTTWYSLHVRPVWYFDWWTKHIFRAVHLRVMEDIRRRAETAS